MDVDTALATLDERLRDLEKKTADALANLAIHVALIEQFLEAKYRCDNVEMAKTMAEIRAHRAETAKVLALVT